MRRLTIADINSSRLHDFRLLESASDQDCRLLLQQSQLLRLDPGKVLTGNQRVADAHMFLIQGEVEIQESANVRYRIYAGSSQAREPIPDGSGAATLIRALDDVVLLAIPCRLIESLTPQDDVLDFTFEYSPVSQPAKSDAVETASDAEDWMTRIRKSPLLAHLSDNEMQRCFMELERIEFKAGDNIVSIGEPGDYFYVLFEGQAQVITDARGPFRGAVFDLVPGSYFGEEALITGARRNATVGMKSDGAAGRLDRARFDSIFRTALIQHIDLAKARSFLDGSQIGYKLLDVRSMTEFLEGHAEGAHNLPIDMLRKALADLDSATTYLVTTEAGARSDLGVFLLRQAGLKAFLIS